MIGVKYFVLRHSKLLMLYSIMADELNYIAEYIGLMLTRSEENLPQFQNFTINSTWNGCGLKVDLLC